MGVLEAKNFFSIVFAKTLELRKETWPANPTVLVVKFFGPKSEILILYQSQDITTFVWFLVNFPKICAIHVWLLLPYWGGNLGWGFVKSISITFLYIIFGYIKALKPENLLYLRKTVGIFLIEGEIKCTCLTKDHSGM